MDSESENLCEVIKYEEVYSEEEKVAEDVPICRICFDSEDGGEDGKLFRPCNCKGTMAWIHIECLNKWRTQSANTVAFWECPTCKFKYHLGSQFWVARILNYKITIFFLSCSFLVLIIWLSAFPAKCFLLQSPDTADWLHLSPLEWKDVYSCFSLRHFYVGSVFTGIPSAIISFFSSLFTGNFYWYRNWGLTEDRNKKVDKCTLLIIVVVGLCYALYHIFQYVYEYVRHLSGMFALVILDAPQWRRKEERKGDHDHLE